MTYMLLLNCALKLVEEIILLDLNVRLYSNVQVLTSPLPVP